MKRISIIVAVIAAAFILVNCQKEVIETPKVNDEKQAVERTSRISFVKSAKTTADEKQQDFNLVYVERKWIASMTGGEYTEKQSKTKIAFLAEYKTGDEYKLHNFDVVWDEKLDADSDGKLWMNLKVYHKTYEENAKNTVIDSAEVVIPDIEKFSADTISKLWLRFINTTDTKNVLTLQYEKSGSTDNSSSNSSDSEDEDSGQSTAQDSTNTGSTTGTTTDDDDSSSTTAQDSTNMGSTTGTTTGDDNSGSTQTDDDSSSATAQDSTNMGSTTGTTTGDDNSGSTQTDDDSSSATAQDSTNMGSTTGTTTDDDNSGSTQTDDDSSSTTTQDSTGGNN